MYQGTDDLRKRIYFVNEGWNYVYWEGGGRWRSREDQPPMTQEGQATSLSYGPLQLLETFLSSTNSLLPKDLLLKVTQTTYSATSFLKDSLNSDSDSSLYDILKTFLFEADAFTLLIGMNPVHN